MTFCLVCGGVLEVKQFKENPLTRQAEESLLRCPDCGAFHKLELITPAEAIHF